MNARLLFALLLTLSALGCSTSLTGSARLYEEKGDYNMAIAYYERAAGLESQQMQKAAIYMQLASLYARVDRIDSAQARLEDALAIVAELPEESIQQALPEMDAEYCLALSALEKGNYKRCISLLENMLSISDEPDLHYYLSIACRKQSEAYYQVEATSYSEELTTASSEFRHAIEQIRDGSSLIRLKEFDGARAKFSIALEWVREDSKPGNDYEKALLMLKKRKYMKAIQLFLEMRETSDVRYCLAIAYQTQAEISAQKAIDWLQTKKEEETRENVLAMYEDAIETMRGNLQPLQ